MATLAQILRSANSDYWQIASLRAKYSKSTNKTVRRNLLKRIRKLEDHLNKLYAQFLKKNVASAFTVFGSRKPRAIRGLFIEVDVSTDGKYFSNPAPKINNGQRIYVRTRIESSGGSSIGEIGDTPDRAWMTWVYSSSWGRYDKIGTGGRHVYFVSLPLTVTRELKAPASGSTKQNFGVYVDVFKPVDPSVIFGGSTSTAAICTVILKAGSYWRSFISNGVITGRSEFTTGGFSALMENHNTKYYWPAMKTYRTLRKILSGAYYGYYINPYETGVTFSNTYEQEDQ